ncbi:MAG: type II toxin-antitoxin system VapC family toxin [Planctomycetes bacterium]|nr:type II toxin-antitoxin system VapC family toxin [Planctomycetota bacterium]
MKNSFVTVTMALILRLEKRKLNRKVNAIFESAENEDGEIIIPAMVLAEVGYLAERGKIETNLDDIKKYCTKYESIIIEPITEEVIEKAFEIDDITELHDRIIAGTALKKRFALITNDPIISSSRFVEVIW